MGHYDSCREEFDKTNEFMNSNDFLKFQISSDIKLILQDPHVLYNVYAKEIICAFAEAKCNAALILDIGTSALTNEQYQYFTFELRNNETAEVLFSIVDQPSIEKINDCLVEMLINFQKSKVDKK